MGRRRDFTIQLLEWERAIEDDPRLRRLVPLEEDLESLDLDSAAEAAALESSSFSRYFHANVGTRFCNWRSALKVARAMRLLRETSFPIQTIALTVGFGRARSLRRAMNRHLGVGPAEFRESRGAVPTRSSTDLCSAGGPRTPSRWLPGLPERSLAPRSG